MIEQRRAHKKNSSFFHILQTDRFLASNEFKQKINSYIRPNYGE